ncbi:MAG: non-canonical purine NTP pyrophosphatase [Candidatus Xenobia bacterium]
MDRGQSSQGRTGVDRLGGRLLLATSNAHKVIEIKRVLAIPGLQIQTLEAFPPVPPPEETGRTFIENARIKADAYRQAFSVACLAEDSGLEIDALDRRPGVHSARFLGADTPYPERHRQILEMLADVPAERRTARYVCAMIVAFPDGSRIEEIGTCEGRIADAPSGQHGFGYDPIFLVPQYGQTFGDLPDGVKDEMSHRAVALHRVLARLRSTMASD